ncbi:MAG TPA: site-specific integrase [Dermatophilaceae bacterium]|nr:site-specific integrase [Dermatophilaceae bacterium]
MHAVLRKAFNDAVRSEQLLATNPAERAKHPRRRPAQTSVLWSPDQLRSFLDHAGQHRLGAFYALAAHTGARRGELLAVRWKDVDLVERRLWIRGSVSIIAGQRVEGTPKSGRQRSVSLDATTVETLRRHVESQEHDRAVAMGSWVPSDLLFRAALGSPVSPDTVTALFAKLLRQYNDSHDPSERLPHARLHDLRHLHATYLLRAGVPVHVVSERLGHADPAITLRVYAHVLEGQAQSAADVFAQVLDGVEPPVSKTVSKAGA